MVNDKQFEILIKPREFPDSCWELHKSTLQSEILAYFAFLYSRHNQALLKNQSLSLLNKSFLFGSNYVATLSTECCIFGNNYLSVCSGQLGEATSYQKVLLVARKIRHIWTQGKHTKYRKTQT